MGKLPILLTVLCFACNSSHPAPTAVPNGLGAVKAAGSTLIVKNETDASATVYIAFGSDSNVLPSDWGFCPSTGPLSCGFQITAHGSQVMPLRGKYLNATIAFNDHVGCGSTKAELNLNNPKWFDILDVSLVDGYSNKIKITAGRTVLGPPVGKDGNEKALGVFPYGCDICTGRKAPPCGIPAGGSGCKSGSQYNPDVICQWQGPVKGGGTEVVVSLTQ